MKSTKLIGLAISTIYCSIPPSVGGQGFFQNLNFESADLSNPTGDLNSVPITSALPGWSASINGVPVTQVTANAYTVGAANIAVFGPGWHNVDPGIIDGNYTVFLQAFNAAQGNVSIWQNGAIPTTARSLQFSAWSWGGSASISVSFAGNALSPVALSSGVTPSGQDYTVYGVNMAPYAGQGGQLEFTSLPGGPDWNEFDDIAFSTNSVVPEPDTLALILTGGLAFGLRRWRGQCS